MEVSRPKKRSNINQDHDPAAQPADLALPPEPPPACPKPRVPRNDGNPIDAPSPRSRLPSQVDRLQTPMHPEYPCAHCIESGVAAAVVEAVFGSPDIPEVAMTSSTAPGVTHRWTNMEAFANEIAEARICAGFHYRFSTRIGTEMGRKIGARVERRPSRIRRGVGVAVVAAVADGCHRTPELVVIFGVEHRDIGVGERGLGCPPRASAGSSGARLRASHPASSVWLTRHPRAHPRLPVIRFGRAIKVKTGVSP